MGFAIALPTLRSLIADARANRQSEEYPDSQTVLNNLPVLLRGLCDFALTEDSSKADIARRWLRLLMCWKMWGRLGINAE